MNTDISVSEQITYSTVKINCVYANGKSGSGTGFIVHLCKEENRCIPVLVTNKHVVDGNVKTLFQFCKQDDAGNPIDTVPLTIEIENSKWVPHPDNDVDLCVFPLSKILNALTKNNEKIFYIPITIDLIPQDEQVQDLNAIEEIIMVGYPIGLMDEYNNKPIIRRGITATHLKKDYQGKKEFLVDMACFPGSSGSPIFILNQTMYTTKNNFVVGPRFLFVGVLYGGPQYTATGDVIISNEAIRPVSVLHIPTNLGIAIKASRILDFEKLFESRINTQNAKEDENNG